MKTFNFVQGKILSYSDSSEPRICTVLQIPDHYLIQNVQLPSIRMNQIRPLVGSIVLVASFDSYTSYLVSVLREPEEGSKAYKNNKEMYGSSKVDSSFDFTTQEQFTPALEEGEVVFQAAGEEGKPPGTAAHLHITNDGSLRLISDNLTERLIVGGRRTSDDNEVYLSAANFIAESTSSLLDPIQSVFEFDSFNNIEIKNQTVIADTFVKVPISELTMDAFGFLTLRNTIGIVDDTASSIELDPLGNVAITGTTINLNVDPLSASLPSGVARLGDEVVSNIVIDPIYWTFWQMLSSQIAALPVTPLDGGATLKAGLSALFALVPLSHTGAISTGSLTVFAGD